MWRYHAKICISEQINEIIFVSKLIQDIKWILLQTIKQVPVFEWEEVKYENCFLCKKCVRNNSSLGVN